MRSIETSRGSFINHPTQGYMNSTTYNEETKIVSIEPGGHWQPEYKTLAPYGVTVTKGRAGAVGVEGFVTGRGNSFHSIFCSIPQPPTPVTRYR